MRSKISIIIPVYNTENYLSRCVESILSQTFTDFEIILVNDGSTDNSGKICDEYASKDSRIIVIHQENAGPAKARNIALDWIFEHSNSEYLTFIDSDDWVHIQYLELLYQATILHHVDYVQCSWLRTKDFTNAFSKISNVNYKVVTPKEADLYHYNVYAWAKLYNKKCFETLRFPVDMSYCEDLYIYPTLLFSQKKIVTINEKLYFYFVNSSSITGTSWTEKNQNRLNVWKDQCSFYLNTNDKDLISTYFSRYLITIRDDKEKILKSTAITEDCKKKNLRIANRHKIDLILKLPKKYVVFHIIKRMKNMIQKIKNMIKRLLSYFRPYASKFKQFMIRSILKICIIFFNMFPIKKNKIVFWSFAEGKYSDNPRAICEALLKKNVKLDLVWVIKDINSNIPEQFRKVKPNSLRAWFELATAKAWVCNYRNFMHPKKKKSQVYLQTWHGTYPFKYIEKQTESTLSQGYINAAKEDGKISDGIISSSHFFTNILKEFFYLNGNTEILEYGTPCYDILVNNATHNEINANIRKMYNVSNNKKIILYAPTFRKDYSLNAYSLNYTYVLNELKRNTGDDYVFFVRYHPNISNKVVKDITENVIDVTLHPDINDLYISADYLITDFSSVVVPFALLRRPVFLYASDYDTYIKNDRSLNELYYMLPCTRAGNTSELVDNMLNYDIESNLKEWEVFFDKIQITENGNASELIADWLLKKMGLFDC